MSDNAPQDFIPHRLHLCGRKFEIGKVSCIHWFPRQHLT
jgi:hypothetical protein